MSGVGVDLAGMPTAARLRASWRRSRDYGVDRLTPRFRPPMDGLSPLHECATEVLTALQGSLADEPVGLIVADAEGFVLERICRHPDVRDALDRVHLAPGFSFAEQYAGTNGVGLSLADRTASLVRGPDHYCSELRSATCAAAPVRDLLTGDVVGVVNLTTPVGSSSNLLLALAQAAAKATGALLLARSAGADRPPARSGEAMTTAGRRLLMSWPDPCVSPAWQRALAEVAGALAAGRVVAVVGEPGSGKTTLAALARRQLAPRTRLLQVRAPADADVIGPWLDLWSRALADSDTSIVVSGAEGMAAWAGEELAAVLAAARRGDEHVQPFTLTASGFTALPDTVAPLVDTVVEAPPLRDRREDVLPLAAHFAERERRRPVALTGRAAGALTACDWPGNAAQLWRVIREAAVRTDVVDLHHLAPEVLAGGRRVLGRLEALERDEIVRCLTEPGTTVARAAEKLGIGRATLYRKIAQYDIRLPGRAR